MIDPATLAAAVVTVLSPYLAEAAKAGATKVGEAVVGGAGKLYQTLKKRLSGSAEEKALVKLEVAPEKPDAQAALRLFLEERLATDPDLLAELADLVKEARPGVSIQQIANITGDGNTNIQIAGSGNRVGKV
jgi:type II secretory pathway pseudopilin PulG